MLGSMCIRDGKSIFMGKPGRYRFPLLWRVAGRQKDTGQMDLQPTPLHSFPGSSPGSALLPNPVRWKPHPCQTLEVTPHPCPFRPSLLNCRHSSRSRLSGPHVPSLHFTSLHLLPQPGSPLTCPLGLLEVSSWSRQTSCLSPSPQSC